MKHYAKIDKNGFFLEDVVVEKIWTDPVYEEDGITVKKEGFYAYPTMDKYHIETLPNENVSFIQPKWNGSDWIDAPTLKQKEEAVRGEKTDLEAQLKEVHRNKTREVVNYISNTDLYTEKREEYLIKSQEAEKALLSGDFSFFDLSAQLNGVTAKQYAELVIEKSKQMLDEEKEAIRRIGDIRSFIADLIDTKKFFQAQKMLNYIKEVKPQIIIEASNAQLVEIIQTYSK